MAISMNQLPEETRADKTAVVLTVSSLGATHDRFRAILQRRDQKVLGAGTVEEARRFMKKKGVFLIVTDRNLPDGTWRDILHAAEHDPRGPLVIVTCRDADELLWGEVLNLGGYDVLAQPLEEAEVTRIAGMASLHWKQQTRRMAAGGAGGWAVRAASA
jgi:DNA-binding NtrC family response regulator